MKKIIINLKGTIIFLLSSIVFIIISLGFSQVDPSLMQPLNQKEYSSWMNNLKDEAKLNEIAIPGSHDAGSFKMLPQAMTQGHDIYNQLQGGVRYFDLRVTNKGDSLVIFHGPIKGMEFKMVLAHINQFILENPSEFLILDFQHLGPNHLPIIQMIKDNLDLNKMLKFSFNPDISQVNMELLRANKLNFMIVWKDSTEALANDFYTRQNALLSQYNGSIHKKSDEALINEFANYYLNYDPHKLFVLQAQRTAKNLLGKPSNYEKNFKPLVNEYILNIRNNPDLLAKTNIIMRDFVISDLENIKLILSLNSFKNLYK